MGCRGNKADTIADFTPSTDGEMGNQVLPNANMGPAGRYPYSPDYFKRSIKTKIPYGI